MDIRNKLKQLMDDNNVSMYRLAKEIGVHQSTIKNWIDGSTIPKIDRIGQIADFFDIPVADLIEHEDTSAMAPYEALSQLYSNIDRLCSASGYSIPQLEAELGYGGETIKKWAVKPPTVDKIIEIADYFAVPVDQLLGRGGVSGRISPLNMGSGAPPSGSALTAAAPSGLMGYENAETGGTGLPQALSGLTPSEQGQVLEYIDFLKSRRK